MMSINIKDITDIIPFISNNLSECAYIIVISIVMGFFVGKQFEKGRQKKKVIDLETQLIREKEEVGKINAQKEQLEKIVSEINKECEILKNRSEIIETRSTNSQFSSLSALERMLDSKEGKIELTALIELNYKKDKDAKKKKDVH